MHTALEKSLLPDTVSTHLPNAKLVRFWNKWGIWLAIVSCLMVLLLFTDFSDVLLGMRDGYADSERKEPLTGTPLVSGAIIVLIAISLLIGLLSGTAHIYYTLFHKHVFRKNQLAYTILYIICLLLLWNFMSDGMAMLLNNHKSADEKIKQSDFNEMLASALSSFVLIYMIVYGFITDFRKNRKEQLTLIQQRTQAELEALKAQVNPHFLFNSLNNIYGTAILEDSPRTAESIQQLSGIVRYVMEESRLQTTNIQRELRFVDDYVELQRIRLPNQSNISISTQIDWDEQPAQIVPLLLNPLIENAFKYGISIQHPCFVRIRLQVQSGTLSLITENSILPRTGLEKGTGLGLANVRQRLALAYPERHTLRVEENSDAFRVELFITL